MEERPGVLTDRCPDCEPGVYARNPVTVKIRVTVTAER
jgi:hypothetical protein